MERRFKIIIACVAAVAVAAAVVFILMQPAEPASRCGDDVCNSAMGESWETCPLDCAKPVPTDPVEAKIAEITKRCKDDTGFLNKSECLDRGLFLEAVNKLDLSYCERISSLENKDLCKLQIIGKMSFKNGSSECDKLDEDKKIICLDTYYYEKATEENNVQYCYNISNIDGLNACHDLFFYGNAIEERNCSMIKAERKRSWCLYDLATEIEMNKTRCQEIPVDAFKEQCLKTFGEDG